MAMIDYKSFKAWLKHNNSYSTKTECDIISRLKRADGILKWYDDRVYVFYLEQSDEFKKLPTAIRSQIKKAVKLYFSYLDDVRALDFNDDRKIKYRVLSLFSNIGVAEAYLDDMGFEVVVANELIERRASLYSSIYPNTNMICGDITNEKVFENIVNESINAQVNVILATPPCQGMSTAGQQNVDDERNKLICPVIEAIKRIKPLYVFIENVPLFFNTEIAVHGERILIPDLISRELDELYEIKPYVINTQDYSVPQTRERAIILMTSRTLNKYWTMPEKSKHIVTMRDAIGDLPKIDPYVKDVSEKELLELFPHYYERKAAGLKISPWNIPPCHVKRQVVVMQHTPPGCTAFDNDKNFVPVKSDGSPVKGYHNTYKRQNWDTPAYTVTMDNRKISSQNNVHPGRVEYIQEDGTVIYSDPRTLTLYELMTIMSLPKDWPVPTSTSEAFLRRIIGEGIPPLFVKKVFENIPEEN